MYATKLTKSGPFSAERDDPAFEARVVADEFIEPKDWMPEAYRRIVIRQISQHTHSAAGWSMAWRS